MAPDSSVVRALEPAQVKVRALSKPGQDYALYLHTPVTRGDFGVRWTGSLVAPTTGSYTLTTVSDDGVRLWVDGRLVIDRWNGHPVAEDSATVTLTAGRPVELRLEYYQGLGDAVVRLLWSGAGRARQAIPASALRPAAGEGQGLSAEYFEDKTLSQSALRRVDATIDFKWDTPPIERPGLARGATIELSLRLPPGEYQAAWLNPRTGHVDKRETVHGGNVVLLSPPCEEDVALSIRR